MKKIISFILVLVLSMALFACGKEEITMQEINDASQTEALLKNHQSVYVREEMDGEVWSEIYLTKDYVYNFIPGKEGDWIELITDDASYYYINSNWVRYVPITPDGVSDFVSLRAERSTLSNLSADASDHTIESVSEKDGCITVKTFLDQDILAEKKEEFDVTSAKYEYVLDARTREIISLNSDIIYGDGMVVDVIAEVSYDADVPETVKTILEYDHQTENLRNVTIISNPGTEKEESKNIQAPKGMMIGLHFDDELANKVQFYTDADCTEAYDPYVNTDSDLTIYVKWTE